MLIKAPSGSVNLQTVCGIPRFSDVRMVTGSVAAEEAVPQAVIHAGEHLSQYEYGLVLVKAKKML